MPVLVLHLLATDRQTAAGREGNTLQDLKGICVKNDASHGPPSNTGHWGQRYYLSYILHFIPVSEPRTLRQKQRFPEHGSCLSGSMCGWVLFVRPAVALFGHGQDPPPAPPY